MGGLLKKSFIFICLFLIIFEFVEMMFHSQMLLFLMSFFGFLILFISLALNFRQIILPISIIVLALVINVKNIIEFDLSPLWLGLREMQPMIVIILVIPLIGMVLRQKPYLESILIYVSKWLKNVASIHFGLLLMTQLVAFFLLPATVPVVYQFVNNMIGHGERWEYIKSTAIYRSVALAGIWAFSFPSLAYAIEVFQVSLLTTMIHGLILAVFGTFLSVFFTFIYTKKNKVTLSDYPFYKKITFQDLKRAKRNVLEFIFLLCTLLGSILFLNVYTSLSLLMIIPFVSICWTLLYYLLNKNSVNLLSDIRHYVTYGILSKNKEINLFIAAGLLISSLETSGLGQLFIESIYNFTDDDRIWFDFLIMLPFIITFLGFIGIPTSAAMILVAGLVKNMSLPYPPESIVIALTLGTVTSVLLSPIAVPSILLSSVNGLRPWQNSMQKNYIFAFGFFVIAECYIFLLNL